MLPFALPAEIFHAGLIFMRIGALVMLMPGFGDASVPPRARLALALMLTLCLEPIAGPTLPPLPQDLGAMAGQVIRELLVGVGLGLLLRIMLAAIDVAGEVISIQSTLSFAQTANPSEVQSNNSITSFLTMMTLALIFAFNLDHLFIGAMARSYNLFSPAKALPLMDASTLAVQTVGRTFALGLQLAAPMVVFSVVFNFALGLIGRTMPQLQVFFLATPLHVLFGLSLLALSLGAIGLVFIQRYQTFLQIFS